MTVFVVWQILSSPDKMWEPGPTVAGFSPRVPVTPGCALESQSMRLVFNWGEVNAKDGCSVILSSAQNQLAAYVT